MKRFLTFITITLGVVAIPFGTVSAADVSEKSTTVNATLVSGGISLTAEDIDFGMIAIGSTVAPRMFTTSVVNLTGSKGWTATVSDNNAGQSFALALRQGQKNTPLTGAPTEILSSVQTTTDPTNTPMEMEITLDKNAKPGPASHVLTWTVSPNI